MTSRMHEFISTRRRWITTKEVADRFLVSHTTAYKVVRELLDKNLIEIRSNPNGRGFQYRCKCS